MAVGVASFVEIVFISGMNGLKSSCFSDNVLEGSKSIAAFKEDDTSLTKLFRYKSLILTKLLLINSYKLLL